MLKRKIRTFLTILGVVIGTAAITVMISLGVGVNQTFDELIEQMGAQALRIEIWSNSWDAGPFDPLLDMDAVERINSHPHVRIATPMAQTWLSFQSGRYTADSITVIGIIPEAMPFLGFYVAEGPGFDLESDELQILLSANARYQFRNERNRDQWNWGWAGGGVEATIDLLAAPLFVGTNNEGNSGRNRPLTVQAVGIMSGEDWQTSQNSFMRFDQFEELQAIIERQNRSGSGFGGLMTSGMVNREEFNQVMVVAYSANHVSEITEYIQDMGFQAWSSTQMVDMQRESTEMLQGLLAAIAGVSLVVAAISIANTMVMSIYERTREIGIMKVIGASIRDIRQLFLIEAGLIGAIGGAVGLLLSAAVSYLLNNEGLDFFGGMTWMDTSGGATSVIPTWLYVLSFCFASIIGLVSGFLPARRATKISALAAIKTD